MIVGIPMAHFCSWAQQSASRGHAWVARSLSSSICIRDGCTIVIMTPAAAALVDRSVTSDIPRDHCIGHVLYLPVLPRWCKLLSSFTASIILLPQQLHALRDGRTTHFLVCLHTSIGIDCQFGYDCHVLLHLAMDGEGSM